MTQGQDGPVSVLAPGRQIGDRYRVDRQLGTGGMGAVYLATHLELGRQDAVKVLRPGIASDTAAIARFRRGAQNAGSVRHENVCTIYDFFRAEEGYCLAMEFVAGESLEDVLARDGPLPLERGFRITQQVAAALGAAHAAGIVHRDLKPANIMLTAGGAGGVDRVKVVDFDISKGMEPAADSAVTATYMIVGTPKYMSPEQLLGEALDGRSDVYSLALVFYRILTGACPFPTDSREKLWSRAVGDIEPKRLADMACADAIPEAVQAVLDRALRRSPEDRTPSAAAFATELRAALVAAADETQVTPALRPPVDPPRPDPDLLPPTSEARPHSSGSKRLRPRTVATGAAALTVAFVMTGWLVLGVELGPAPTDAGPEVGSSEAGAAPDAPPETGPLPGTQADPEPDRPPTDGRSPAAEGTSAPVANVPEPAAPRPAAPAVHTLSLGEWGLFEEDFTQSLRFGVRYDVDSPDETAWCLAVQYRDASGPVRALDGAAALGGGGASYRTIRLAAGRQSGATSVSSELDGLDLGLDLMNARNRFEARLAAWPKPCAEIAPGERPMAESDLGATVCLIRSAAGIASDPVCR